jgi:hypothetical protein
LDTDTISSELSEFIFTFRETTFEFIDAFPLKCFHTIKCLIEDFDIDEMLRYLKEMESLVQIMSSILSDEKILDFIEIMSIIEKKKGEKNMGLPEIISSLDCFNDLSLSTNEKIEILKNEIEEMIEKDFILNSSMLNLMTIQDFHAKDFKKFLTMINLFKNSLKCELFDKLLVQISKIEKLFKNSDALVFEIISQDYGQIYELCFCCFYGDSQFMIETRELFVKLRNQLNLDGISTVIDEMNQYSIDNNFFSSTTFYNSIIESNENLSLELDKSFLISNQMKSILDSIIENSISTMKLDFKNQLISLFTDESIPFKEVDFKNKTFSEILNKMEIQKDDPILRDYVSNIEQEKYIQEDQSIEMKEIPKIPTSSGIEIEIDVGDQSKLIDSEKPIECGGIAISNYYAEQDGELSFNEGDIIFVLNKSKKSGWWFGMTPSNGEEGYFPSNFFEEKIITKAIHDYDAKEENELSFKEGDILVVLENHSDGWWVGMLTNSDIGQFPVNFTQAGLE